MKTLKEALFSRKNILSTDSNTFIITNISQDPIQHLTVFYDNYKNLLNIRIVVEDEIGEFRMDKSLIKDFYHALEENWTEEFTERDSGRILNFMNISKGNHNPYSIIIEGEYQGKDVSVEYEFKDYHQVDELIKFLKKF